MKKNYIAVIHTGHKHVLITRRVLTDEGWSRTRHVYRYVSEASLRRCRLAELEVMP